MEALGVLRRMCGGSLDGARAGMLERARIAGLCAEAEMCVVRAAAPPVPQPRSALAATCGRLGRYGSLPLLVLSVTAS